MDRGKKRAVITNLMDNAFLMYASKRTYPEISFAVVYLSRDLASQRASDSNSLPVYEQTVM